MYAHPDIFRPRYSVRDGKQRSIGLAIERERFAQNVWLRLSAEPVEVLPGVWTSGEISPRLEPEGRSAHHFVREGDSWLPDPYRDDMALILETDSGLVVICGCCHAGLLNTLAHARRVFERDVVTLIGGTHLLDADHGTLRRVVEALRSTYNSPRLYLNHCTGQRAYVTLATAFGGRVAPCPAGTILNF
jgi:7,8-dihydropterin-6-yl-methyl-4-(beta-D-ribofuranosyl)aminobenzene 5'-phosphate synthase